jgi:hypothetical protein
MTLLRTLVPPASRVPALATPRGRRLGSALAALAFVLSTPAAAQRGSIVVRQVAPETAAVTLKVPYRALGARTGPPRGAFSLSADLGSVRLVPDSAAGPLLALDPKVVTLRKGKPVRVEFALDSVRAPGTYLSRVRVKTATGGVKQAEFGVEVNVTSEPKVEQPASARSTFSVVQSAFGLEGWVVRKLFPVDLRDNTHSVLLENTTAGGVFVVETPAPVVRAERNGEQVPGAVSLLAPLKGSIVEGRELPVRLRFDPDRLAPGKYVGRVPLPFAGDSLPYRSATFTLNVRAGWFLPLLLIAMGIVVGRVAQLLNLPLARMQEELLRRAIRLGELASALRSDRLKAHFQNALADVRRRIEHASAETERAGIEERLNQISSSILLLQSLDDVRQVEASNRGDERELIERAATVEERVIDNDLEGAKTELETLRNALVAHDLVAGANARGGAGLVAAVERAIRHATAAPRPPGLLSFRLDSAEWRYRYLRPGFLWVLIAAVALMGFYTLYIGDPVFGSQGLYDYGKCFLWGLGTDIATKTLQGLSLPRLPLAAG